MSEYQTFSCRHCKEKPKGRGRRARPTYKRMSDEKLYDMVKEKILLLKEKKAPNGHYITVEKMAKECQVKVHRVEKIFMKLNQEGILSKAIHRAPHDSRRERGGWGDDSSWCASYYEVLNSRIRDPDSPPWED